LRALKNHTRGFTLIELLIVVAIIGVLATMLLTAIFSAKGKAQVGVAKSQIKAIQAALAMYEGDHGRFPRHTARPNATPADGDPCWRDDSPALYMALRNRPTQALGGGQNSPYLDWKGEAVGKYLKTYVDAGPGKMGDDHSLSDPSGVEALAPQDFDKINTATFQDQFKRGAGTTRYLVLLDPWQNPYHYREWASVRQLAKDGYMNNPSITRTIVAPSAQNSQGQMPVPNTKDNIHSPDSYDIWSNGPNGVNEYGAPGSDDVTSWSN
jgi:prepilin-type N-terminal cleavage/methylation domain-containing protein